MFGAPSLLNALDGAKESRGTMKFESWIMHVLVVSLVVPMAACQVDEGDVDAAAESDDGDGDEFRLSCPINPGSAPSTDVDATLAGFHQAATRVGAGTGNGCDRFVLGVATPSGHRAQEVTFESSFELAEGGGDAVVGVWGRSCPPAPAACSAWTNIPVTWDLDESCTNGHPYVRNCTMTFDGYATLPANNTYTEVRAGARVENAWGASQDVTITISE